MNAKPAPIGPLALALRRLGAGTRAVPLITVLMCTALLLGITLLLN